MLTLKAEVQEMHNLTARVSIVDSLKQFNVQKIATMLRFFVKADTSSW